MLAYDKRIILGAVYIPPHNSSYYNNEMFDHITRDLLNFDDDDYYKLLCGDFNGHVGTKDDIVVFDDDICEANGINDETRMSVDTKYNMEMLDIPVTRASVDVARDNGGSGKKILELCKENNVCIMNGRVGQDIYHGKATTKHGTVIDYCISSPFLLSKVYKFSVQDFDPMYSDCHNRIMVTLKGLCKTQLNSSVANLSDSSIEGNHKCQIGKWKHEQNTEYVQNIDNERINALMDNMENLNVNEIVHTINNILLDSAKSTFPGDRKSAFKKNCNPLPGYDGKCLKLRRDYHRARKRFNTSRTTRDHNDMIAKSRVYSKCI